MIPEPEDEYTKSRKATVITGKKNIHRVRMLAIKHALSIEINTGMTRRGRSTLQIARDATGIEFRTKKEALKHFEERYPSSANRND